VKNEVLKSSPAGHLITELENPMISLYLDIDGVLLRRTGRREFNDRAEFEIATGAYEFMDWCIERFDCFWLTSRSHDGSYAGIEQAFRFAIPTTSLPIEIKDRIHAIKPAAWPRSKIEGIDVSEEFIWLDDDPDDASLRELERLGMGNRWIQACTDDDPNHLGIIRKQLSNVI
jgi:hypothetical protein